MTPRSVSCFGFAPHGIGIASMSWERARIGVAVAALRLAALAPLGCVGASASARSDPPVLVLESSAPAAAGSAAGVGSGAGAGGPRAPAAEKKLCSALCRFGISALGTSICHLCRIRRILYDGR